MTLSEILEEIVQSTSGMSPEELKAVSSPSTSVCRMERPDGTKCEEELEITRQEENGIVYESVRPCMSCKVVWNLHNAFGWMDHSSESSKEIQSAILKRLENPVSKTAENESARKMLREVVMGKGRKTSAVIAGPTGTGKTFLSMHALKTVIEKYGISGLYAPEHILVRAYQASHDYNNQSKRDWGERFLQTAKTTTLLVLDDFGQYRNMSEGCLDSIEQILMYRYDSGLQVIVTTNRDVEGLVNERGQRMVSRLRGMANNKFVILSGKDWRADGKA